MNKIIFPLNQGMRSAAVADLQDALLELVNREALLAAEPPPIRQRHLAELRRERADQRYGNTTSHLVRQFQQERRLEATGAVDERTANALNDLLEDLGVLIKRPGTTGPGLLDTRYTVLCKAVDAQSQPIAGLRIEAFDEDGESPDDPLGEPATTDQEGLATFRFKRSDYIEHPEEPGPDLYFKVYRGETPLEYQLPDTPADRPVIRNFKPQREPVVLRVEKHQVVSGLVVQQNSLPAEKLKLVVHHLAFGGKRHLLGETFVDAQGRYALPYDPGAGSVNLQISVSDPRDPRQTIPLMKPRFGAAPLEVINLVAPSALVQAEYRRLSADLMPHVGEMGRLGEARENDEQQDLTVLSRATGWDARLIALAAISQRLSSDEDLELPEEAIYGLLRAGLPSDKGLLAMVDPDVVEQALKTVRDAGVVQLANAEIGRLKQRFASFSNRVRMNIPAPGSRSTYGKLLEGTGLPQEAQDKFVHIYLNHRGDAARLWEKAREAGLTGDEISRLQLHGKLAFLAGYSGEITDRLLQKGIDEPVRLVEHDYHRTEIWRTDVLEEARIPANRWDELSEADKEEIDGLIPPAYAGETMEDRLHAYTKDMARKVRLGYPTQVIGRLIETDHHFKLASDHEATIQLLKRATAEGFRLGATPVAKFFEEHARVAEGINPSDAKAARQQLQTLQRVYQITPSNEAMAVLMRLDMTSAYDVMAYTEEDFVAIFEAEYLEIFRTPALAGLARLIRRKSEQVSTVTYNLFTIAGKLQSEPPIAGLSAPVEVRESVRNELIKHFPTMESLFGSMDFCECEHCRSVISPAAYLVDLLQFVDPEPGVWANFLAHWQATHGGRDYPHVDEDGRPLKPYDVLTQRRPDLQHIPLTCENTHTALPYIDIVNEILEYAVAHGKLTEDAAQDTGEATTAELLAEPQNVIRQAYEKLHEARYPLNLPFDLWLETARQFCDYFEMPLHRVLERFRQSDALFAPEQPFDRAGIFMESLGLSPAETSIFTDPNPLENWCELYGYTQEEESAAKADLESAKALSRRLGVTYKEITEIVQTAFVNPELVKLSLLYKLRVSIRDAKLYKDEKPFYEANKDLIGKKRNELSAEDQARFDGLDEVRSDGELSGWQVLNEVGAFKQRLDDLAAEFNGIDVPSAIEAMPFDRVLVLADPHTGCSFDHTILQYADGTEAEPIDFLRINLFVRLWRKLGWTIEETDRALSTFVPKNAPFDENAANLAQKPLETALIYLSHLKTLDETLKIGRQSRLKLLTLWSDIATTGTNPLYAQLFLTRGVLKSNPVFDHPLGEYLTVSDINLKDHILSLQAALGLRANEIEIILDDSAQSQETAGLSLRNVSLLYRYGLLAKALKLSVPELIALKQLSGLDPFKELHPSPLETLDQDYPFAQTLEFVKVAEEVRGSGLRIEDLDYLLRHHFDETGKYRPDREATLALLKTLAEGVLSIRAEHAVPDDPADFTDELLRQKLGLVLPSDLLATFIAMLNGTVEFTATRTDVDADSALDPKAFDDEPRIRKIRYNKVRREQQLTLTGVLFEPEKEDLKARYGPSTVFDDLLDDVLQQARTFFETHLQKQPGEVQPAYGFFDADDYELLFDPDPVLADGETDQDMLCRQRSKVAEAFLPFLQRRLTRQFIVQTMTAHTGADPELMEDLVNDQRLLEGPDAQPLLASFAAAGGLGVSVAFFDSEDLSEEPQGVTTLLDCADTAMRKVEDENGDPVNSARFKGYLEVPVPGAYRFFIELEKKNAEAKLRFDHLSEPVFLKGLAEADNTILGNEPKEFLELKPGRPYRFSLELKKLDGGRGRLLVQSETVPKGRLSQLNLYPATTWDAAERALVLLNKVLQLVQALDSSVRELRYLLTHKDDFGGVDLSGLPAQAVEDKPDEKDAAIGRFQQLLRLAAYARLKREMAGGTDDVIAIFEANGTQSPDKLEEQVYPRIAKLTRRDKATVKACAEALAANPGFESEKPLWRLWEALQAVERFGVPTASLVEWTRIVNADSTPEARFGIARELRESIKARFEADAWQRVAQPIFDKLRQLQRDALVSHVLHQHGFDRMEQLYEHFLIDPGMEPVVQTSRIRLAISSAQLFIQRSLLNLERKVHPSTINSKHWEWMKRYRVWEANRKIFLFPENWLEPEFRDDKTHLFSELEGALLQGDVSSDLVEDAFLNYLKKLDELARLDIVAMHIEDNPDPARRTLHVFGRTYSQPHKYFYRRYAHQMWTPWEPVSAEIEGDHLAPVVWRDRLYLFWVTFIDKPVENAGLNGDDADKELTKLTLSDAVGSLQTMVAEKRVDIQLHWSEYLQGAWSTSESSGFSEVMSKTVPQDFNPHEVFIHVSKDYTNGEEGGVYVHLGGEIERAFFLAGRNSAPENKPYAANGIKWAKPENRYTANKVQATRYSGTGGLRVTFHKTITTERGNMQAEESFFILRDEDTAMQLNYLPLGQSYTLLPSNNNLTAMGVSEEAFQDAAKPEAVKAAIESGLGEIMTLMKPVFYQDNRHTFFVEPNVTEETLEAWEEWIPRPIQPEFEWSKPDWWDEFKVIPAIPRKEMLHGPRRRWQDIEWDRGALINPGPVDDWLLNPGTVLLFDNVLIGSTGQPGLQIRTGEISGEIAEVSGSVNVNPGSSLAAGQTIVVADSDALEQSGLVTAAGGLNVVGQGGFNAALSNNFKASKL